MNELKRYAQTNIVALQFKIGDKVSIDGIEERGFVYSATISRDGIEYCVKWFNDSGTRCADWFQASELTLA